MPVFDSAKGDIPWSFLPPNSTQLGSGTGSMREAGTLTLQTSTSGINPGGTNADNVLAVYTLPANSLYSAGNGLYISAIGTFANNVNSKRVKIIIGPSTAVVGSTVGSGGTTIADTGAYSTAAAATWSVAAAVYKYGAAGSNTQLGIHVSSQINTSVTNLTAPSSLTLTESGAILIALTGNAATTATDIALNFFEIMAQN
jgi:hypothetical protein